MAEQAPTDVELWSYPNNKTTRLCRVQSVDLPNNKTMFDNDMTASGDMTIEMQQLTAKDGLMTTTELWSDNNETILYLIIIRTSRKSCIIWYYNAEHGRTIVGQW